MLSYIDAVQNRKGRVVSVKTVVFSGNVQACLQRLQGIPGLSHWRPFCFSLWLYDNLLVRYIYMIILNSCSLKCLKKVHFFTLTCVFYWTQTPIFTITRKIDNTCVINMLFDSDNTLTNKVISNLWVLLSSPNYLRLPLIWCHIGVDLMVDFSLDVAAWKQIVFFEAELKTTCVEFRNFLCLVQTISQVKCIFWRKYLLDLVHA